MYLPSLSRKLLSRWRDATWAAIQKVRRRRAFPYFDNLVRPRKVPDCEVARSRPQNFKNCRWCRKRRKSPASAKMVKALMGPIPGILQELIVLMVCQQRLSDLLDAIAFTDQAS